MSNAKVTNNDVSDLLMVRPLQQLPATWTTKEIGTVASVTKLAGFEYSKYIKLEETGDIPVIRAQNIQKGRFVDENIKYIPREVSDFLVRSQVKEHEVLMTYVGEVGNVCLAPRGRWHLAPNVAKISPHGIDPLYLCYYLQSPIGQGNIKLHAKSTVQSNISMSSIRNVLVNIPPLEEQKRISLILSKADDLIQKVDQIIEQTQRLKMWCFQLQAFL